MLAINLLLITNKNYSIYMWQKLDQSSCSAFADVGIENPKESIDI